MTLPILIPAALLAAAAARSAVPPAAPPSTDSAELQALLRRAGECVAEHDRRFGDLLAEATYTEKVEGRARLKYDPPVRGIVMERPCVVRKRTTRLE